jgi:hypothetical protein
MCVWGRGGGVPAWPCTPLYDSWLVAGAHAVVCHDCVKCVCDRIPPFGVAACVQRSQGDSSIPRLTSFFGLDNTAERMVYVSRESDCEGICRVSAVGSRAWGSVQSAEQGDSVVVRVSASCCGVTGGSNTLPKSCRWPKDESVQQLRGVFGSW